MWTSNCLFTHILQNIIFCVQHKKEINTGLVQHMNKVELMPKSWILVSSDHNTFTQLSSESLINFRRAGSCAFLSRGTFRKLQDFSPSWRSVLPIVLYIYIYTYIHTHIHTHIHTYIHTYTVGGKQLIDMYMCVFVCVCVCACVRYIPSIFELHQTKFIFKILSLNFTVYNIDLADTQWWLY